MKTAMRLLIVALVATVLPFHAFAQKKEIRPGPRTPRKVVRMDTRALHSVQPLRYARVDKYGRLAEPWRAYSTLDWPGDPWFVAFDCFEADPASANGTPYDGGYGVNYNDPGMGGNRWFFGETFANMFSVNDMVAAPAFALGFASRTSFCWYWGGAQGEACIIVVGTWERFGDTEAGVAPNEAAETLLDGWAFDFGTTLAPGGYFAGVNLTAPDGFKLPADGSGAYSITIANAVGTGGITLASLGQPFLWFTKPNNPSFQGPLQWDDDNPADGVHRTNPPGPPEEVELYDFTGLIAAVPVPAGAMMAFYSKSEAVPPNTLTVTNGIDLGGGVAAVIKSDDVRQTIQLNLAAELVGHQVEALLTGTSPLAAPTSLEFVIEDRTDIVGAQRTVELFNYATNLWEVVNAQFLGTADKTIVAVPSGDPARFVQPGTLAMRAKIGYNLLAADLFFAWKVDIDLAMFRVGHP